ncbi:hypothetical protein F4780DRAFT_779792 [Xylariomycetidae sp. FL0641]|nr:hypothetical protein F4780DRAFT_779792 [Xylariomycetidae sp. FL0641]
MASGHPNTGTPASYEGQDQTNYSQKDIQAEQKHHTINAEGYMPKDRNKAMNQMLDEDTQAQVKDRAKHEPGYAAQMHGNEPSRGAKMDAEIAADEAEMLRKKQEKTGGTDSMPGKKLG